MATIRARKQTDGSTRYTAIVRIRKGNAVIHQEYKTFAHRVAAVTWAKHREVVLEDPSARTRVQHGASTLAQACLGTNNTYGIDVCGLKQPRLQNFQTNQADHTDDEANRQVVPMQFPEMKQRLRRLPIDGYPEQR